jgi:hypothetical protein
MPIKAGQIVIDVTAGTAQFVADMEKAKGKIREFGAAGVGEHKAISAAMKTLEGNFTNNKRAADAFLATIPGIGNALKTAFPVVGAIAFAGVLGEVAKKAHDFFKEMKDAPEKAAGQWGTFTQSLRLSNAELELTNAKLEQDIAKLEGKRQNNLVVALEEARVAALHLGEQIDKDIQSMYKLFKEQDANWVVNIFGGTDNTEVEKLLGGETSYGGINAQLRKINEDEDQQLQAVDLKAKNAKEQIKSITDAAIAARRALLDTINKAIQPKLDEARRLSVPHMEPRNIGSIGYGSMPVTMNVPIDADKKQQANAEILAKAQSDANAIIQHMNDMSRNAALTTRKEELQTGLENAQLDKPFQERMKALGVQLDGIKAKLAAIGQPESVQIVAKAFGEAQKAIEEVNRSLEKHHTQLTADQKAQIGHIEQSIASAEAEATWKEHLASTTSTINDRIRSQELLTAAIGRGYEATKRANVETQLMGALGQHYNDSEWMQGHQSEVSGLRDKYGAEYDAKHADVVAGSIQKLKEQTELERSLAQVQSQGAEAVRLVTLAYRLRSMVAEGATREQIQAEIELFNATRANASAESLDKINQKTAAVQKLTSAVFEGAEAQRKATLENKYAEMAHNGATPAEIAAERALDQAEHQHQITEEAGKTVTAYADQLQHLNDIEAALQKQKRDHGDTLELEIALRDIENERLRIAVQQELKLKGAKDGLKAFFLEMQEDAKSAAQIIYDSLNSALDKTSDQFAKLLTHQKTDFGKMFQSIGDEMVKSSVKSMMQKGLGKLGEKFGIHAPAGKPDGSDPNPFYVVIKGSKGTGTAPGDDGTTPALGGLGNLGGALKGAFGAIGGFFSKLFSGGGGGESVSSSIQFMAEGGDVYPGNTYGVAEAGEFEIFQPRGPGTITPAHKLGSTTVNYHVDARGAELGVESRVEAAIRAAHNSAVEQSVKASAERAKRSPQRSS